MWESFVPTKWTSRSPGGPLLNHDIFSNTENGLSDLSKWKLDDCVFGFKENVIVDKVLNDVSKPKTSFNTQEIRTKLNAEIKNVGVERSRNRRPTYSAKINRAFSNGSEDSLDSNSDSEDYTASSKDLRQSKILEYRKSLTQTVKIRNAFIHEKVKVMCSKDGTRIEWYKPRTDNEGSRKPDGSIPISKITNVATKADNIKHLEISAGNISHIFIFRSREERETWQTEFKKFLDFMKLVPK